jgi:hypothetical protein
VQQRSLLLLLALRIPYISHSGKPVKRARDSYNTSSVTNWGAVEFARVVSVARRFLSRLEGC